MSRFEITQDEPLPNAFGMPDVELPDDPDGEFPELTPEQRVKFFRLQTTRAQDAIAAAVLELAGDDKAAVPIKYRGSPVLADRTDDGTDVLRKVLKELESIMTMKDKLRARNSAAIVDRVQALAFAIRRALG
jgi:hypothetical protein